MGPIIQTILPLERGFGKKGESKSFEVKPLTSNRGVNLLKVVCHLGSLSHSLQQLEGRTTETVRNSPFN